MQAITPAQNLDTPKLSYLFSSWTNGNGLTEASGTFTMPSNNVNVIANYVGVTHTVKFQTTGLSNFDNLLLTIDGVSYTYSDLGSTTFSWDYGTTHTVQAEHTVRNSDTPAKGYTFSSWANGNGLVTESGTLTMPNTDQIITVNYLQSTVHVTFDHSGLTNINDGITVLTIDNVAYDYWDVLNTNFQWDIGSTHTVIAHTPLTTWDTPPQQQSFISWTNGNGLVGTSGTFTTPNTPYADVVVTANYGASTGQQATTLTIACNPTTIDTTGATIVSITGTLTSSGIGLSGKTISLLLQRRLDINRQCNYHCRRLLPMQLGCTLNNSQRTIRPQSSI